MPLPAANPGGAHKQLWCCPHSPQAQEEALALAAQFKAAKQAAPIAPQPAVAQAQVGRHMWLALLHPSLTMHVSHMWLAHSGVVSFKRHPACCWSLCRSKMTSYPTR